MQIYRYMSNYIRYGDCSVQQLSHVQLFVTPWTTARQASLSITNSRNLLRLMSIKSVTPSNHLILCHLLPSCLQSFPGFFPVSQFFASGGQSVGASASVQFSSIAQSCPTLRPHGLQHSRPPCPSPTPGVYSNSCPLTR